MNVISTISAAKMPNAVHNPKFLIDCSPNATSEKKLNEAIAPAASITAPTLVVASMTAMRLCSVGVSSGWLLRARWYSS